jgi:dUTPase
MTINDEMIYSSKDPWAESKSSKVEVFAKPAPSSAKDYHLPYFNKISTKIDPDSNEFIPSYDSNSSEADLFANLDSKEKIIGSLSSLVIDCGFNVEIPSGYKIKIASNEFLKNCGILADQFLDESCYNNSSIRIKVFLTNISKDPVTIKKNSKIARISIEPIYIFEWLTRGFN